MLYKQHKYVGDSILVGKNALLPSEFEATGRIVFSQKERIEYTSRAFFSKLKHYNELAAGFGLDDFRNIVEQGGLVVDVQRTFGDINGWAGDHAKLNPPDGKAKKFEDLNVQLQIVAQKVDLDYASLALSNWDHFMPMSYKTWQVFHRSALRLARNYAANSPDLVAFKKGIDIDRKTDTLVFDLDATDLAKALFIEAYGCHFLQDSFVAGHLRTPRLLFGRDVDALHSKFMHDEDNKRRLVGSNKEGSQFRLIGEEEIRDDFTLLHQEHVDDDMKILLEHVTNAVATSVQQVFDAAYGMRASSQIKYVEVARKVPQVDIYWRKLDENRSRGWALEIRPRLTSGDTPKPLYKFHADYDDQEQSFKDPIMLKRTGDGSWRREGLWDVDHFAPGKGLSWWVPKTPEEMITVPS